MLAERGAVVVFAKRKIVMSYRTNTDNIFKVGAIMSAKIHPQIRLTITKYYQRIYYCSVVDDPTQRHIAYFERELIPR